jgi:cytochrome bd-type quinol oxidase subunit 2
MAKATYRKMSRALVIALAAAVALVSYDIKVPAGRSSASNWKFVATHPTILLHVIVATMILVTAVAVLIMSARSRNHSWIVLSAVGLAFVLLAFASGDDYVATLRRSADDYMGIGWFGAIVTYATAWYLSRKTAQQENAAKDSPGARATGLSP